MNTQIISELNLLNKTIDSSKIELRWRLGKEENSDFKLNKIEGHTSFGELLYAITKDLSKTQLLNISDKDMIKHIQLIQLKEKETY